MADYIERISIHAPLAGRDVPEAHSLLLLDISIHAPLAGRDYSRSSIYLRVVLFQSTRPLRGATPFLIKLWLRGMISIHAPLAGRDESVLPLPWGPQNFNPRAPCGARRGNGPSCRGCTDFNPRAPCGARRHGDVRGGRGMAFQSTRPLRGATPCCQGLQHDLQISIHAPLAGRDVVIVPRSLQGYVFQSTRPLRGAT